MKVSPSTWDLGPGHCPSSQVPGRVPAPVVCVQGAQALSPQVRQEPAEQAAGWSL